MASPSPAEKGRSSALIPSPLKLNKTTPPPLPVPDLSSTIHRYLLSLAPLLSKSAFRQTALICFEFLQDTATDAKSESGKSLLTAAKLQQLLLQKAAAAAAVGKSWLIDDWVRLMYTSWRSPLPLNVSYWYLFRDSAFAPVDKLLTPDIPINCGRAAALVLQLAAFRDMVFSGTIPDEKVEGSVLDKSMYRYLFHSCRFPRPGEDGIRVYDGLGTLAPIDSIVVIRKGHYFLLSLNSAEPDSRCSWQELASRLQKLWQHTDSLAACARPVGLFTAANRDIWAAAFVETFGEASISRMSHDVNVPADTSTEIRTSFRAGMVYTNWQNLQLLESALCVLCLDDAVPASTAARSRLLLDGNPENRWFDKVCQVVVCANGASGFIGEHSFSDGMPTAVMLSWVFGNLRKGGVQASSKASNSWLRERSLAAAAADHHVISLPLLLPDACIAKWDAAKTEILEQARNHDCEPLSWTKYGREAIKRAGVSPDAWAQLAIQLAYYLWREKLVPTYEPAQARRFLWGRTACIRVVTAASAEWVKAMTRSPPTSPTELRTKFRAAGEAHTRNSRLAGLGQDIDRHLLGLKLLYQNARHTDGGVASAAVDKFFKDPSLSASSTWYISTSNLSVPDFENWGWGEVVHGGIGVAYSLHADELTFNVVAEKFVGVSGFVESLRSALTIMMEAAG